ERDIKAWYLLLELVAPRFTAGHHGPLECRADSLGLGVDVRSDLPRRSIRVSAQIENERPRPLQRIEHGIDFRGEEPIHSHIAKIAWENLEWLRSGVHGTELEEASQETNFLRTSRTAHSQRGGCRILSRDRLENQPPPERSG